MTYAIDLKRLTDRTASAFADDRHRLDAIEQRAEDGFEFVNGRCDAQARFAETRREENARLEEMVNDLICRVEILRKIIEGKTGVCAGGDA